MENIKRGTSYITVRIDYTYDADQMDQNDAINEIMGNTDYNFEMPEGMGVDIEDTEICGLNY